MNCIDKDNQVRVFCDYPNCKEYARYCVGANDRKLDVCKKHKDIADFIVELIKLRLM